MTGATTTEPLRILAWDIKNDAGGTTAVIHFGTQKSCRNLKRRKNLPTYDQVRAAERARRNLQPCQHPKSL